jgi:transcriptional regulator with XRE-family HTH domain
VAKKDNSANKAYGERLRAFRKKSNLSQEDFAKMTDVHQSYIASIEKGDINIGLNALVNLSEPFAVEYYQLSDPAFPIPPKNQLRENIKKYIKRKNIDPSYLKDEVPNLALYMDELIDSDFFLKARTGKEIAEQYMALYHVVITPSRIADMLSRQPRKSKIDTIKPEIGRLNKYKLKAK